MKTTPASPNRTIKMGKGTRILEDIEFHTQEENVVKKYVRARYLKNDVVLYFEREKPSEIPNTPMISAVQIQRKQMSLGGFFQVIK